MNTQAVSTTQQRDGTVNFSPRRKRGGIDPRDDFPDTYDDMHLQPVHDDEGCFVLTTWHQPFLSSTDHWPLGHFIDQWSHICLIDYQTGMAASRFIKSDVDSRYDDAEYRQEYSWKLLAKNGCKSTRRVIHEFGPRSKTLRACAMVLSGRHYLRSDNEDVALAMGVPVLEDVRDYRLMCDILQRAGSVINIVATGTSKRKYRNPHNVPRLTTVNTIEKGWCRVATPELKVRGVLRLPSVNIRLLSRFWNGEPVQRDCSRQEYARIKTIDGIIRGLDQPTQRQCRKLLEQHGGE